MRRQASSAASSCGTYVLTTALRDGSRQRWLVDAGLHERFLDGHAPAVRPQHFGDGLDGLLVGAHRDLEPVHVSRQEGTREVRLDLWCGR